MGAIETLKKLLAKEYEMKDLGEVKTIIGWQITRDTAAPTMKSTNQHSSETWSSKKNLQSATPNVISMKAGSAIEMTDPDEYEETELSENQRLIGELMYLACGTRPDIAFVVGQLSKHNAIPEKVTSEPRKE